MEINLLQEYITHLKVDAIVNAANSRLLGGSGVDGSIHRVGGRAILEECKVIGVTYLPARLVQLYAAEIAMESVRSFLSNVIQEVTFVCFETENYQLYKNLPES